MIPIWCILNVQLSEHEGRVNEFSTDRRLEEDTKKVEQSVQTEAEQQRVVLPVNLILPKLSEIERRPVLQHHARGGCRLQFAL